jgi:hypothetical protein
VQEGFQTAVKRPCDLVRHEKAFYNEIYISRAYKFASPPAGFARAPTPPDTSSNASADWDDLASESEQEDIGVSETTHTNQGIAQDGIFSDVSQKMSFATDRPLDGCNQKGRKPSIVPALSSDFFEGTPFDSQGCSYLDNNGSNLAGLMHGFVPFFDGFPEDTSLICTREIR